ncbi:MAG: HDIG domain-containing protein [Candidatus Marinimicrobia bacterium]|nr:HDIG domain-containing protein [Candidatus Neomarinimicrobiota bacterium]MCD6099365.1 HDIG domain-containing protein [Candidatus Neomarinimicrobiota bacterium]HDN59643.1 HDIG domain-containing protein [Candidatus Neomarinimicrobiota bacterium]
MNREEAWKLLCEYTKSENLRKHALAVEAAMRLYARKFGEDEEKWGIVGLLHDFDYEMYPDEKNHPYRGYEILEKEGYPEDVRKAILSHASYTGVPRDSLMARTLFAVDELTGFIIAVALVRPTRSIHDVTVKSVKKKFKQKAFAAKVSREEIKQGIKELGVDEDEHIQNVIDALKSIAKELGLEGK